MARLQRALSLRPVNSVKHENTWSFLIQNASATQGITIVNAVDSPSAGTPQEVHVGSTIKWIYFEMNLNGVDNSGSAQVFHWLIFKNPQKRYSVSDVDPTTYNQDYRRQILKRGMEMLPEIPLGSGGTVQTKRIFVVKIPRGLSRMGQDDAIQLNYKSTSASSINFCGITVYKEFY